nr:hypothetical protein KPHV_29670 [Kitasatospora purpeofusca]
MDDMLSRVDSSNVVLIGCHRFTELDDLPAVENNLLSLKEVLTDPRVWGLPEGRIEVVDQPSSADDVLDAVRRAAESASDTLVVYYSGHGLTDPYTTELYLALTESQTEPERVRSALRFEYLRRIILGSRAEKTVVLIDCCFSGRALLGVMGDLGAAGAIGGAIVEGTCVVTAASETAVALAEPGEEFTAFTGALISALRNGLQGAGELIDMDTLYRSIHSELQARSRPLPQQRNRNTAGRICIARNRAFATAPNPAHPERHEHPEPKEKQPSEPPHVTAAQAVETSTGIDETARLILTGFAILIIGSVLAVAFLVK